MAVRNGSSLNYLLNDHLGSTSVILKTNGAFWGELRYSAWGETRYSNGTIVTDRQYTGQINDGDTGLYYYNARYYDPALHRFIQADTIVPDPSNPQSFNRFSYVRNNPVRYNDPTGHKENPWEAAFGMGGGGMGLAIAGAAAGTGYYAAETFIAIVEFADAFDLTPPPSASEQLPPETPPLELPTTTGIPAPVAPPFSGGYTTVAQPKIEFPQIMTMKPIALGLDGYLDEFANARGASTYNDWWEDGIMPSNFRPVLRGGFWNNSFIPAMNNANEVNFNLKGLDIERALKEASQGIGGYTSTELWLILHNREWYNKTTFYDENGQPVELEYLGE